MEEGLDHGANPSGLGDWLRARRVAQNVPVNQLAHRAGVARSTVIRWESGARRPRLPELDLLLRALDATPEQRDEALYRIGASRAVRSLQETAPRIDDGTLPPPAGGDLLRAMRCRRRLTQEQVAAHLGIQASTVCRWERSEASPSADRWERLLDLLGAHPEERATLAEGHQRPLAPLEPLPLNGPGYHEVEQSIDELEIYVKRSPHDPLIDLRYLSLQARLWPGLRRYPKLRYWFANSELGYTSYLLSMGRSTEAASRADRAIQILQRESKPEDRWIWAAEFMARAAAESERHPSPERAVETLERWLWLPGMMAAECRAGMEVFLRRQMAYYLGETRRYPDALEILEQVEALAAGTSYRWEVHACRLSRAELLARAGRPEEAVVVLPEPRELGRDNVVETHEVARDHLIVAEVLLAAGDRSGAHEMLGKTYRLIDTYQLEPIRRRAGALAERLNEGERGYGLGRALVARDRCLQREARG